MRTIIFLFSLFFTCQISAHREEVKRSYRDSYNRGNADALFDGFFPQWGVVLLILSGFFLVVSILGLVGYFMGCRRVVRTHQPSSDSTAPFFVIQNCAMNI